MHNGCEQCTMYNVQSMCHCTVAYVGGAYVGGGKKCVCNVCVMCVCNVDEKQVACQTLRAQS